MVYLAFGCCGIITNNYYNRSELININILKDIIKCENSLQCENMHKGQIQGLDS